MSRFRKVPLAIASTLAGAVLIDAAFRVHFLNWIVDVPGSLVNRIFPVDLHEGEGVFGFFLAIFLSWSWTSTAIWFVIVGIQRLLRSPMIPRARK